MNREANYFDCVRPHVMAQSGRELTRLRGAPLVAKVQAADLRNGDDTPRSRRRDGTRKGCILVQAAVPRSPLLGHMCDLSLTEH